MVKSVPSIVVMGALGVGLLSVMMQQLAEFKSESERSPFAASAENALGLKGVGRVDILRLPLRDPSASMVFRGSGRAKSRPRADQPHRLLVRAVVIEGANSQRTADRLGRAVWLASMRAGVTPRLVRVVLREAHPKDARPRVFNVAQPR